MITCAHNMQQHDGDNNNNNNNDNDNDCLPAACRGYSSEVILCVYTSFIPLIYIFC